MSDKLTTIYSDIPISYDERANLWRFELRGRDRCADSLAKAKEIIDKPEPKEKTFKRIKAWLIKWNGQPELVDVTSIAEGTNYQRCAHYWVTRNGQRSKEAAFDLANDNEDTRAKVEKWTALNKQHESMVVSMNDTMRSIHRFETPTP